jgi:hypothetical protein
MIQVATTAVYRFRFYNDTRSNRKCSIKIQRIPASEETKPFNTNVVWHTQYDTSYYTVQEKYLKKQEHVLQEIIPLTVSHIGDSNTLFQETNSRIIFPVQLPEHTIEWYYRVSFSHHTIEEIENSLTLADELSVLMAQTGGIKFGPYHLTQAPGQAYCDVYVMDSANAVRFQSMEDYKYSSIGSSKHIKSGITKVYGNSPMPLYLGINNVDSGNRVNILIECVAIILKEEKDVRAVEKMNVASRTVPILNMNENISWVR